MRTQRVIAALAGMLMAVSLTGPARAAAPAAQAKGGDQILVAPPAPPNAKLLAEMGIAAAEPTTTPGVTYHPIPPGGTYKCSAGYFCPIVWNPVTSDWRIFFMYYCRIQTVYNWNGNGFYYNNQIPPVNAVQFFDQFGVLNGAVVVENPRRQRPWDWTPVWSMDVC